MICHCQRTLIQVAGHVLIVGKTCDKEPYIVSLLKREKIRKLPKFQDYSFYIFNFADTFITIGVFIYILDIVISKSKANGNKVS